MATAYETPLMTAEEFAARPTDGPHEELECGRIVISPPPGSRHGFVCGRATLLLGLLAEGRGNGYVVCNDAGVVTTRNPDTVRGMDVAFYPLDRLHGGKFVERSYHPNPPELVVEVKSPGDRWSAVMTKVGEYLGCGVSTVVVLDPGCQSAQVYTEDEPVRLLTAEDDLTLGGSLDGFREKVGRFFE